MSDSRRIDAQAVGPLVLASGSLRRRALLTVAGYEFESVTSDVDETVHPGESPAGLVRRLAAEKALAVCGELSSDACVLGFDTVVVLDGAAGDDGGAPGEGGGEILGKPEDAADAVAMLLRIAGRRHRVLTGYVVVVDGGVVAEGVAESEVTMHPVTRHEAEAYAAGGEPLDKAGSYALQGEGARFVAGVVGSRANVIGLPLGEVVPILDALGVRPVRLPDDRR